MVDVEEALENLETIASVHVRKLKLVVRVPPRVGSGNTPTYKRGMHQACKVHAAARAEELRTEAEQLAEAEAFLRDTTSRWARAIPLNERRRAGGR